MFLGSWSPVFVISFFGGLTNCFPFVILEVSEPGLSKYVESFYGSKGLGSRHLHALHGWCLAGSYFRYVVLLVYRSLDVHGKSYYPERTAVQPPAPPPNTPTNIDCLEPLGSQFAHWTSQNPFVRVILHFKKGFMARTLAESLVCS